MLPTRTRNVSDGAFATTVQQSWRGSGFQSIRGGRRGGRYPQRGRHPISQFTQGRNQYANRRQAAQMNNQANRGQATFGNNANRGSAYDNNNNNAYRGSAHNANRGQASNYFAGQCNTCGQHGHIARFCPQRSLQPHQRSNFNQPMVCHNCGGQNHTLRNCTAACSNAAPSNHYDESDYTGAFGAINMMIRVVENDALYLNTCNTTDTINQGSSTKLDSAAPAI